MPQSLFALNVHIVFSTKERRPFLKADIQSRVWGYMSRTLQNLECHAITVGGVEDHVHILCRLTKKHPPMKVMEILKKDSSKFVKTLASDLDEFHWQDGYGLFSISESHVDAVREYVLSREEHHRKISFKEEFIRLLEKNGLDCDERYLWD